MQLAPMYYVYSTDTKARIISLLVSWARDNRLEFVNSRNKLNRLTKTQLTSIAEQLRYTPRVETDMARRVFADYGIHVKSTIIKFTAEG